MANKILFGADAVKAIKRGIDIAYQATANTLGSAGKNSVYRSFYSRNPIVTNDGVSIIKMIDLEDEASSMGVDLIKQAASRTNDEVGDGTTSSIILAKHIIDKGLEMTKNGTNAMQLNRQIGDAVKKVVGKLKEIAVPIKTDEDMFNIANIAMENPDIAQIVVEAVKKSGENGTVLVEESHGLEITKEEVEGLKFDKGYMSPYMVTNPATMEAVMNDVQILITDKTFSLNQDIFMLLEEINKRGSKQILIICENMQGEVLSSLIANRVKGLFHAVVVQKPVDNDVLNDIAVVTGGEVLNSERVSGNAISAMHFAYLGQAKKVVITKDSTLIIGGKGDAEKIKDRVESIKISIKDTTGYKKEMLKERLAKLVGGVVIIKVGAPTEADMKYLKLKIDDAVASTKAAIEEGIVIGGGKALYELSLATPENAGEEVIYFAMKQPIRKIIENAGFDPDIVIDSLNTGEVWNSSTCETCKNPMKIGLVDPAKVERCALENAASVASKVCTMDSLIVEIPQKLSKEE